VEGRSSGEGEGQRVLLVGWGGGAGRLGGGGREQARRRGGASVGVIVAARQRARHSPSCTNDNRQFQLRAQ
jgi:hypothetical protein